MRSINIENEAFYYCEICGGHCFTVYGKANQNRIDAWTALESEISINGTCFEFFADSALREALFPELNPIQLAITQDSSNHFIHHTNSDSLVKLYMWVPDSINPNDFELDETILVLVKTYPFSHSV